jgi:hypothetical protein
METPIVSARPEQSGFAARDLFWLTPLALVSVAFASVVAWPAPVLLCLYLFVLDTWAQDRLFLTALVMLGSAVLGFAVIRLHRPSGKRSRPTAAALARAASWWQVLFLPMTLEALAWRLRDDSPLLHGWLFILLLQPLGTLLLRRTRFLLTGAVLKAVVLVPPSVTLLLAVFPAPGPYGYPDVPFNAALFHLVGAVGVLLAASIPVAALLVHRAEPVRGRA